MLPVFRPLRDRGVLTVWSGLCASTIGEDLFRVAAVWLAVEAAGNMAGLITAAQYAMMLVVGLAGGVLLDGWRATLDALTAAAGLMLGERVMGALLLTNAVVNGPWLVALNLAIALIVTEYQPSFLGFGGLAAYALVMGAYGVGDVSGNLIVGS